MLAFSKYTGAGNDFVLVDDRALSFPVEDLAFIRRICHRQLGVGADGLILLQPSSIANFRMRIFNADAGEAEMCGNGVRCLAKFVQSLGYREERFLLQTMERLLTVSFVEDEIAVDMGAAKDVRWNIQTSLNTGAATLHLLDTGVPHAVYFVSDVEAIDPLVLGPEIRFHPAFQPKGVNANFAHIADEMVHIRTYERGVEGETLACGTGATATAIAAHTLYKLQSPVKVKTRSGDILKITVSEKILMQGPASLTFKGILV